jgi:hypothetical protein
MRGYHDRQSFEPVPSSSSPWSRSPPTFAAPYGWRRCSGLPQCPQRSLLPVLRDDRRGRHCARSTVAEAIRALEDAGILSWVHRLKRVRVNCPDLFGADGVRVVPQRTSNAYHFIDPSPAGRQNSPGSDSPPGTANQDYFSSFMAACGDERTARSGREGALRGGAGANVRA